MAPARELDEILRSLIARIKARDFGIGFYQDLVALALAAMNYLASDPTVFAGTGPLVSPDVLEQVESELNLDTLLSQGIQDAETLGRLRIKRILRDLVDQGLEALAGSGLPPSVIEWLSETLERLKLKI